MCSSRIVRYSDLADTSALIDMMVAAWPGYYTPDRAAADIRARSRPDALPMGLACLDAGGAVIGGVTLAQDSFGQEAGEGPWLVGLVVDAAHRKQGVGAALVAAAEEAAQNRGDTRIWTTTRAAASLMTQRGWSVERTVTDNDGANWQVLSLAL